jgi:hypothetical protein
MDSDILTSWMCGLVLVTTIRGWVLLGILALCYGFFVLFFVLF